MTGMTEAARAAPFPGRGIGAHVRHVAHAMMVAMARRRTERALADLDAHLLRDIGMEGARRFEWQPPTDRPEFWR